MTKDTVSTRLDSDDLDRLEQYAERRDLSEAEATRRMIRLGLRVSSLPLLRRLY